MSGCRPGGVFMVLVTRARGCATRGTEGVVRRLRGGQEAGSKLHRLQRVCIIPIPSVPCVRTDHVWSQGARGNAFIEAADGLRLAHRAEDVLARQLPPLEIGVVSQPRRTSSAKRFGYFEMSSRRIGDTSMPSKSDPMPT